MGVRVAELTGKCDGCNLLVFKAPTNIGMTAGKPHLAELGVVVVRRPVPKRRPECCAPLVQSKGVECVVHVRMDVEACESQLLLR